MSRSIRPFSLPEIDLYAQLVDLMDRTRWRRRDYRTLYDEVRGAVDRAHADGSIKDRIAREPERYILPDPNLPATLHRLKTHGYRLFLLTNSEAAYTSLVMDRLLSHKIAARPRWTEFFDVLVVRAGKPGFFRNRTACLPVHLPGVRALRESAKAVTGGGVRDLERTLGCGGDRILYFGDHTYGDILKSKRVRMWRTAMIVQELEGEIETRERLAGPLERLREEIQRREHLDLLRDGLDRTIRGDAPPGLHGLRRSEAVRLREGIDRQMRALEDAIGRLESGIETRPQPALGADIPDGARTEPLRGPGQRVRLHLYLPGLELPSLPARQVLPGLPGSDAARAVIRGVRAGRSRGEEGPFRPERTGKRWLY